ncbi:PREDICTED: UPF0544 protein C5orf45 homolog, partial [Apaloderma vittatum]|uniref:UPF0544 protein C5orf45 homolog n=1 Tax=Apaloderma vittatum TaxID=57397 RepID=UPI00052167A6
VYGQGSGLDCRRHVQKLNLLQGEAEEAIGWMSWHIEDFVNDSKNIAAQPEGSSVQQEGGAEVNRWRKYLDKDSEDQEDEEEEAGTERQQFCSRRENTVEEQRKHQKSLHSGDVQEYAEENGVFQLAYQAKKRKKCLVAAPGQDDGGAVSGDRVVSESIVPEEKTPTVHTKPSKWEKFLSCSENCSDTAASVTLSPQEGSGRLGLHSTAAVASRCPEQAQGSLRRGTGFEFQKCVASTEQLASKLPGTVVPSTSYSVEEDVLSREPRSQFLRAGSGATEPTAGRCCLAGTRRTNTLINCNTVPRPSSISCEQLFCTNEDFDDDL